MASGHHSVVEQPNEAPAHDAVLTKLLDSAAFSQAVAAYKREDDDHDIPFLGASDQAGDKIYFDRAFVEAVRAGKVKYAGRAYNPLAFLRIHEAVEGAAIRLLHADYERAHELATWAERRAVEHTGLDWNTYQASLKPFIRAAGQEKNAKLPADLVTPAGGKVDIGSKTFDEAGSSDEAYRAYGPGGDDGRTTTIHIIRHGATKLNNDDVSVDRIRGWVDVPLSKDGKAEAQRLAVKMQRKKPTAIVSSDLRRASDTAHAISKTTGVPVHHASMDYRPWNVGDFTGKVSKDALPHLQRHACETPDHPVPGGESFSDFRRRFFGGLLNAAERHGSGVAVVAHHRNERLLHAWKAAGYPASGEIDHDTFCKKGEPTGSISSFDIPHGRLRAAALGGNAHIEGGYVKARKLPHAEVQYGPGHLKGDHCAICKHFEPEGPHCEIVADPIKATAWCSKFQRNR